jgi:zinc transport system substrate-binding protein
MRHIFLILIGLSVLFFGCISSESDNDAKISAVVTIPPQAEFVKSAGGGYVDVIIMVPSGASPHTYEPTPSQMAQVANADIYFKVGSGIEFENAWMHDIEEVNPKLRIVDCSSGIELIEMASDEHENENSHGQYDDEILEEEHNHIGVDPHIWTSAQNAKIMIENIETALIEEDPQNALYYQENAENYIDQLDLLDSKIQNTCSEMDTNAFIVFHPAWGYFARDYNLRQIAIEEAGKEPTAKNIISVVDTARQHNISVVFASPQFSTTGAESVASEIDGQVVLIDPLEKEYLSNMESVAEAFRNASK